MSEALFKGDGFLVTHGILRTPRRTYELKNVEIVTVKQPLLLLFGGVGLGLVGFTVSFFRYLYVPEVIALVGFAAVSIAVSAMFGTLKVHSLAMRSDEGTLYGRIGTLRAVKEAVSEALDARD
ncbi:hypothetical protein [Tateyamaria sp. ANG-S1]|uniref:hypothetical protein n=1 Tax=Tateyamaria sp. ANG-S1 TaxID=1577905 RepID=UPI00057C919A|nr:hypothetical protein [Tateyamaria sp. ANG-S1]KIC50976.1 hypothetical protein RA29_03570 [Tateyamaria sp. ANG-S1]